MHQSYHRIIISISSPLLLQEFHFTDNIAILVVHLYRIVCWVYLNPRPLGSSCHSTNKCSTVSCNIIQRNVIQRGIIPVDVTR